MGNLNQLQNKNERFNKIMTPPIATVIASKCILFMAVERPFYADFSGSSVYCSGIKFFPLKVSLTPPWFLSRMYLLATLKECVLRITENKQKVVGKIVE